MPPREKKTRFEQQATREIRTIVRKDLRDAAAISLMRKLFTGKSDAELADEAGLHRTTIWRRHKMAREDGVPEQAREIFINEMLPSAMAVVQEALASEDMKVAFAAAKMVIDGLDAMKVPPPVNGATGSEETLESWRASLTVRKTRTAPGDERGVPDSPSRPIAYIDATPIPSGPAEGPPENGGAGPCGPLPLPPLDPGGPPPTRPNLAESDGAGAGESGVSEGTVLGGTE